MKLAKVTRKRLRDAQGKPIWVTWPKSAPEPYKGHRYPVFGKDGRLFDIRIEAVKRRSTIKVLIVIDGDPHRPMVGIQGTRNEQGDYESEPERVDKSTEQRYGVEAMAKTALLGAERRRESASEGKEATLATSHRSERAKARHKRSLEGR